MRQVGADEAFPERTDVILRLKNLPEFRALWQDYIDGPWTNSSGPGNELLVSAGATGIVKDSKDLKARPPVNFRETSVRWHIDRSATGQRDIIVFLQHRKEVLYLSGIAADQDSPEKLRRCRIGKRRIGRLQCYGLLTRMRKEGRHERFAP